MEITYIRRIQGTVGEEGVRRSDKRLCKHRSGHIGENILAIQKEATGQEEHTVGGEKKTAGAGKQEF